MSIKSDEPKEPLPSWLLLPLVLGILLTIVGLAFPSFYPKDTLWTDNDAKQHNELALQAHAAHHASANAQTNNAPTVKQDVAKAKFYRDEFDKSAQRLRQVRDGGENYGWWLMIAGIGLTSVGVVAALILRKE